MSGRSMTLDVLVRLRDNLSGPLRRLRGSLQGITDFTRRIGVLSGAIAAISFMGPIQEAAAFQQQLLDMAGTADLSGREAFAFVDEMQGRYEDLAVRIGQHSQTIAEAAGQMIAAGLSRELIDGSIEDIGRAATAANALIPDMAAVATSMMKTLDVPANGIRDALGALVIGGKEGAFELKDMAAHFPKLTAQVAKFGVKGREAVDFLASALQIARMGTSDPATAANNLNNFLSKALAPLTKKKFAEMGVDIQAVMLDAVAKGINPIEAMLQKIGKLTGSDGNTIAKYMSEAKKRGLEGAEALAFLREQLEAIGAAGKISELFQDQQVLDFLIPFMANVEEYKRIKDRVAAATGQAIDADFETQVAGLNRQLGIMKEIGTQGIRMVGMAFGEWLPKINDWLSTTNNYLRELDEATGGWVKKGLVAAGGAVLLGSALGVLGFVLPAIVTGLQLIAAPLFGIARGALLAARAIAWLWAGFSSVAVASGFTGGLHLIGATLMALPSIAWGAVTGVVGAIAALGAPILAVIALVAALALAVWNYWEPISNFVAGFASEIGGALGELGAWMAEAGTAIVDAAGAWAKGKLVDLAELLGIDPAAAAAAIDEAVATVARIGAAIVSEVKAIPGQVMGWLRDIFTMNDYSDEAEAQFRDAGARAGKALVDNIKSAVDGLVGWFAGLPGRIAAAIGSIDIGSLISWPRLPSWLGGSSAATGGAAEGTATATATSPAPAQPQAPVRLDGNINATIKVQGPGTVTGVSSDNDRVKVGTGRMVGNQ